MLFSMRGCVCSPHPPPNVPIGLFQLIATSSLFQPAVCCNPRCRRHLWDLIDRVKGGCAVVLTTHSMEEADILGDRQAGMALCTRTALRFALLLQCGRHLWDCMPCGLS